MPYPSIPHACGGVPSSETEPAPSREFNLIDSPWIKVTGMDMQTRDLSLKDCLLNAHKLRCLSGETGVQDFAMLRLLLAILLSVYAREGPDEDQALDRWQELWEKGKFGKSEITDYLDTYHDRFWLFDKDRPFYQSTEAAKSSKKRCSVLKLNGAVNQSGNKKRLFSSASDKEGMPYAEAARWLVFLQGYDDGAVKSSIKGGPLLKPAWLGRIGGIYAQGNTLFETLMLNLILLKNGDEPWPAIIKRPGFCAVWELDRPVQAEKISIPQPDTLPALYTLQSRRVFLIREGGLVTSYIVLAGEYFEIQDAYIEQMTSWKPAEKKGAAMVPRCHTMNRQMWRDLSSLLDLGEKKGAGLVRWLCQLRKTNCLDSSKAFCLRASGILYGSATQSCFVDFYDDGTVFRAGLLEDTDRKWRQKALYEIDLCQKTAYQVSLLARNLARASGYSEGTTDRKKSSFSWQADVYYAKIDRAFRLWLKGLDPEVHDDNYADVLRDQVKKTACSLARDMVEKAGPAAFRGRFKEGREGKHYSSPEAMNEFNAALCRIYGSKEKT